MITLLTLLLITGVIGAAFVAFLLRDPAADDPGAPLPSRPPLETYRPMTRLFSEKDFAFLAAAGPAGSAMLARLRRQRRDVMRLYLRQARLDFDRLHRACRNAALRSRDSKLASKIARQAFLFYFRLALLRANMLFRYSPEMHFSAERLLHSLESFHVLARTLPLFGGVMRAPLGAAI
jgi:hypothetical protein